MKSSHHVNFRGTLFPCFTGDFGNVGNCHLKSMRITFLGAECAELAAQNANIGVVHISVENIGRYIAILPLPDDIGQKTESVQIARSIKTYPLLTGKPFSSLHLFENWQERRVEKSLVHDGEL